MRWELMGRSLDGWLLILLCHVVMIYNVRAVVYGRDVTTESKNRNYPFAISILMNSTVLCGGILIKAEWTLTTCSCVGHFFNETFKTYSVSTIVLVGGSTSNLVTTDNYEQVQLRRAEKAIRHARCTDGNVWGQDYGAYMSSKFEITKVLRPAKFESEERLRDMILLWVSLEAACETIGWGTTVINFTTQYYKPSNILKVADVHLMDWGECGLKLCQQPLSICDEKIYNLGKLCAMNINGSDSCDKDEGGALICGGEGSIVGLASASLTCGEYFKPRLYSSILDGYGWIESVLDGSILSTTSAAYGDFVFTPLTGIATLFIIDLIK